MTVAKEVAMEREKLIEAARLLKENCAGIEKNCYKDKVNCPFQRKYMKGLTYYCELRNDTAQWNLPEVQDDEHG